MATDQTNAIGKSRAKLALKEGIIPFLIQFGILVTVILEFVCLIANDVFADIESVPLRTDLANDPNIMRLIYMFLAIPATAVLVTFACKTSATVKSFWLALIGGIVAWQGIGECSWHFGLWLNGNFSFFPKIEGAQGTFILALALPIFVYLFFKGDMKWGIKIFLLSFFCNWVGHWVIAGIEPWFNSGKVITPKVWQIISGFVFGFGGTLFLLYRLFFKAETKEQRLTISLLLYTTVGVFIEGVVGIGAGLE